MNNALWLAILSGPAWITADKVIGWLRNRRKDNAEAGLAVDQRWERYTDQLEQRLGKLEGRVTELEKERETLLERVKGLIAEVDHYRRIARAMARHVLRLRDALANADTEVPALPAEVEDALTVIDLPPQHG